METNFEKERFDVALQLREIAEQLLHGDCDGVDMESIGAEFAKLKEWAYAVSKEFQGEVA